MNNKAIARQIGYFLLFVVLQLVLFRNLTLFGYAFAFPYLAFLLLLPVQTSALFSIILGFVLGITVDIFYDTLGIHAAASVLMAYFRSGWLRLIAPSGGYETVSVPSIQATNFPWFLSYSIPLLFVHHVALFFIEAGGFVYFWISLKKIGLSTILSSFLIIFLQYLFIPKRRNS
jgi:hypothetical protein